MTQNKNVILKLAAALLMIIGLIAIIVAWSLLLVSNMHNNTVLAIEFGGVLICMGGYFLWRYSKRLGKDSALRNLPDEPKT